MNKITFLLLSIFSFQMNAQLITPDVINTKDGDITIQPITHGTLVFTYNNKTIYVDPYGGADKFKGLAKPDFILITDIHQDHLNLETLKGIDTKGAIFIVPQAVADKLPSEYKKQIEVLNNRQGIHRSGLFISAVAMYNLPESEDSRHPKGRGNGYLIHFDDTKVYVSGDTSAIPEMRQLYNIDIAFVCMNLPYTMDVQEASSGVLDFKPTIVYPYHYRGTDGLSDIEKFKTIVNIENSSIDVRLRDWYIK
ncbi:MAG: MBL fold metallo-hydrolase [Lutibacter sp.]|nr:MAG: MBL fold metallo-hydrolase [Lutibacter sp.]